MNQTQQFISHIEAFSKAAVSRKLRDAAKGCFIDYLGVAAAGCHANREAMKPYIKSAGGYGVCSVIGLYDVRVTGHMAAFLNGFNAHTCELDDGHRYAMIHPGAPVISALIAATQEDELDWDRFLLGIIAGYEAAISLARAIQPEHRNRGYHVTGTCGTAGAAVAVAAARGYTGEQMQSTLACAATSAAGLLEMIEDTSQLKPYNAGRAAMDGLNAAMWGKTGVMPPQDAIGGKRGLFRVLTGKDDCGLAFSDEPEIFGTYKKPYASCRHCHPAIEAAVSLRGQIKDKLMQIESVNIGTYKSAIAGHDHTEIHGAASAKMSIAYCTAAALALGHSNLDAFSDEALNNKLISDIISKIKIYEDEALTQLCPGKRAAVVEIVTADGSKVNTRVDYPKGEPENPMPEDETDGKMISLCMHAGLDEEIVRQAVSDIRNEEMRLAVILELLS